MRNPLVKFWLPALACLLFAGASAASDDAAPHNRQIFGWIEWVQLSDPDIRLRAKLDTGATTSSLNAINKEYFKRDGKDWVSFDVIDRENDDAPVRFEREVVRRVRILRAGGGVHSRPVVEIGMCVGDIYRKRQFTLADRTELNYQVLVGRNYMEDHVIVDSAETYTRRPSCKPEAEGAAEPSENTIDTTEEESE